jgi:hypothetical protein
MFHNTVSNATTASSNKKCTSKEFAIIVCVSSRRSGDNHTQFVAIGECLDLVIRLCGTTAGAARHHTALYSWVDMHKEQIETIEDKE